MYEVPVTSDLPVLQTTASGYLERHCYIMSLYRDTATWVTMSVARETATWCHSTEKLLRDVALQKHWYMTSILLCSDLSLIMLPLVSTSPGTYSWHLVIGSSCAVHSNCLMISTKAWLILAKLDIALFTPWCLDIIETVSTKLLDHSFQTHNHSVI